MTRITGDTTLNQLEIIKAQYGVDTLIVARDPVGERAHAHLRAAGFEPFYGEGATVPDAIDEAFARLQRAIILQLAAVPEN